MDDLVRLLVIGLAVAAILVPIVRWFWSRFDRPTEAQIEYEEERKRQKQEARMWAQIEAKMRADEEAAEKAAADARYRLELEAKARGANRAEISGAISALGSEELQPVLREVKEASPAPKATVSAEEAIVDGEALLAGAPDDADLVVEDVAAVSLDQDRVGAPEPDWELIQRLQAMQERGDDLGELHADLPAAPDLPELEASEDGLEQEETEPTASEEPQDTPVEPLPTPKDVDEAKRLQAPILDDGVEDAWDAPPAPLDDDDWDVDW